MSWYGTDYDALDYIEGLCIDDSECYGDKDDDDIKCPYNENCKSCPYPGDCYH